MMEKGLSKEDKGKTLDELDIELQTWEAKSCGEAKEIVENGGYVIFELTLSVIC